MPDPEPFVGFASPNYTQTPNDFFDDLMKGIDDLSELKVTLVALRQTFGYHRERAELSVTYFEKMSGLSRNSVRRGIELACRRGTMHQIQESTPRTGAIFEVSMAGRGSAVDPQRVSQYPSEGQPLTPLKKVLKKELNIGGGAKTAPTPPPEIEKPDEKPIPPSGVEIDFPPVLPRERVSVEERRARVGAAAEIGAENVRRGKKKGVADPWEQSTADAKEWGLQVASVVMGEDVTAEAIAHLPRDFRSTVGYKGRDIQADIDGGCVPREMYVKAFEYFRNGGRAAIGEPVTPNRVMKQIVAYVMNGGKPPVASGATSYYGKPFDRNARSPDEIERERREADNQSELYWKRRREFEAAQAREFHDLSGTDVSPA